MGFAAHFEERLKRGLDGDEDGVLIEAFEEVFVFTQGWAGGDDDGGGAAISAGKAIDSAGGGVPADVFGDVAGGLLTVGDQRVHVGAAEGGVFAEPEFDLGIKRLVAQHAGGMLDCFGADGNQGGVGGELAEDIRFVQLPEPEEAVAGDYFANVATFQSGADHSYIGFEDAEDGFGAGFFEEEF